MWIDSYIYLAFFSYRKLYKNGKNGLRGFPGIRHCQDSLYSVDLLLNFYLRFAWNYDVFHPQGCNRLWSRFRSAAFYIIPGKDKSNVWYHSIPFLKEKGDDLYIETAYTWNDSDTCESGTYAADCKRVLINSPFVCVEHCTFAGEYLGLIRNPDYNTDRPVFKVNDRICNKEVINYFERIREQISKEGKSKVSLWHANSVSESTVKTLQIITEIGSINDITK